MPPRGQLTEQAYQTTKERLLNGDFKAGDRISVEELVVELGTSRQPVMDALKRLATERYIEIIPQVGVRVVAPRRQEIFDFFRLLAATQAVCAQLAAERADKAGAEKLAAINEQIGVLLLDGIDDDERAHHYRALNRDFHRQLNALAESDFLTSSSTFMWDHSDFYVSSNWNTELRMARLREAHEKHELICQAIAANNPDSAYQAMEKHVLAFIHSLPETG